MPSCRLNDVDAVCCGVAIAGRGGMVINLSGTGTLANANNRKSG